MASFRKRLKTRVGNRYIGYVRCSVRVEITDVSRVVVNQSQITLPIIVGSSRGSL